MPIGGEKNIYSNAHKVDFIYKWRLIYKKKLFGMMVSTENPTDCNKKILIFRDFLFETFIIMSAYHTVSLNIFFSNKRRKFSLRRMRNCRLYIQRVSPGALDDALTRRMKVGCRYVQ